MKNIVVLISGSGSNLQAIIDACGRKQINGTLRAVFSNKADAFGLERARAAGIPAHALAQSQFADREAFDRQLMHEIDAYAPDLVVLAGYMRILSPAVRQPLSGTSAEHPSFVTAEVSRLHTHRQVLENGDEEHGTSVHFVTDELDGGPVILQAKVPVFAGDSEDEVTARVQAQNMPFIRWSSAGSSMGVCAWQATTPGWMNDNFRPRAMPLKNEQQPRLFLSRAFF